MEMLKVKMKAAGIAEGEAIGLEKGKVEEKKMIAKTMLAEGFTVEQVMRLRGLGKAVVGRLVAPVKSGRHKKRKS